MMNNSKLNKLVQIKNFLAETDAIEFNERSKKQACWWIEKTLRKFHHVILSKKEKGLISVSYICPEEDLLTVQHYQLSENQ
jgi:hypothetical protein